MKQRISTSQLQQLTPSQQEKLRAINQDAEDRISSHEKMLRDRGLLVDKPCCGWQLEALVMFNQFKHNVLANRNEAVKSIL